MQSTRRFALGALAVAILSGCGGGSGGSSGVAGSGAAGGAAGSGSGAAGAGGTASGPSTPFPPVLVATNANSSVAPAATRLSGGGNAVLWVSGGEVRGRLTNGAGMAVGDTFLAVPASAAPLGNVAVAPTTDGGFVLAWIVRTVLPFSPNQAVDAVQARRFDAAGNLVWDARATGVLHDMGGVRIEPAGDGFVLGWTGRIARTSPMEAWIGRIAGNGTQVGDQYPVGVPSDSVSDEVIGIAPLADGTLVAVWRRRSLADNGHTMYMRHFAADLAPLTPAVALPNSTSGTAFPVDAKGLANGNVAIAWGRTGENTRPFVSTAVFSPSGTPLSAVRSEVTELPASDVQVLSFGSAGYGVAWQVVRGAPREVSATPFLWRFSLAGEPAGGPQALGTRLTSWVSPTTGETVNAGSGIDFAASADGRYVVAYHEASTQAGTYLLAGG